MAIAMMQIEKEKPGCIVEKAEFIKEDTIGWKVALLEPGEERKRRNVSFAEGGPLSEAKKKEIIEVLQKRSERTNIF